MKASAAGGGAAGGGDAKPGRPVKITIVGASNLYKADVGKDSDPYCVCEAPGRASSKFQTPVLESTLNPVWNHEVTISDYKPGDPLRFSVWDKDPGESADDPLGRCCVGSARFAGGGFEGEVPLTGKGTKGVNARLRLRIRLVAEVTIKAKDLKKEFDVLSGGDGSIDFSEIVALEKKFGLPMEISGDMKYWKDGKVTYTEFVDMLKRNGNIGNGNRGNIRLQVHRDELRAAFREAAGGDNIIDFGEIEKVEMKYALPMNVSGDMKYWKDMKVTEEEFIEMLERNGNVLPDEGGEGASTKAQVRAIFRKHMPNDDMISLDVMHTIISTISTEWTRERLEFLFKGKLQDGRFSLDDFCEWCFP